MPNPPSHDATRLSLPANVDVLKLHATEGLARRDNEEHDALPGEEGGLIGINWIRFQNH